MECGAHSDFISVKEYGHIYGQYQGSLTRQEMDYTLNHWAALIGYCDYGQVNISNALAENAIRPFAVGRKAWLWVVNY